MTYIELVMYAGSFFLIQNVPDQLRHCDISNNVSIDGLIGCPLHSS